MCYGRPREWYVVEDPTTPLARLEWGEKTRRGLENSFNIAIES